jgi:hypothetical protein
VAPDAIASSGSGMIGQVPVPRDAVSSASPAGLGEGRLLRKEIARLRGLVFRAADDLNDAGQQNKAS